ncbi:MAG: hypothetical protein K2I20_01570 [Clostridia bacterium]|nr:hypothetical protein [Clostridia bacterium]
MKKSLKVLFAVIACIVLMCPLFAGCASDDAEYVEGSFNYEIDASYSSSVYVSGSFEADFNGEGKYSAEYDIDLYYKQKLVATESCKSTKTVTGSGTGKVSFYESVTKTWTVNGTNSSQDYSAKIRNVKITRQKSYDNSHDYALGFGVTAAVLACGITAFFVATKLRENKK